MDQKINKGQKVNMDQISKIVNLSKIVNIKLSSEWLENWRGFSYFVIEYNHQLFLRSTSARFLKLTIFIQFTWNLKRSCIFRHWIQPPIIFEVIICQKVNIRQWLLTFLPPCPPPLVVGPCLHVVGPCLHTPPPLPTSHIFNKIIKNPSWIKKKNWKKCVFLVLLLNKEFCVSNTHTHSIFNEMTFNEILDIAS